MSDRDESARATALLQALTGAMVNQPEPLRDGAEMENVLAMFLATAALDLEAGGHVAETMVAVIAARAVAGLPELRRQIARRRTIN